MRTDEEYITRGVCPSCRSRIHPGCNREDCKMLWCERAKCGWQNDELCFPFVIVNDLNNLDPEDSTLMEEMISYP